MRYGALVVGVALAIAWADPSLAQGRPVLAPAELPPPTHSGDEWRDSRGCQFVRSTTGGEVTWLPVLDAQRQPVCGLPPLAQDTPPERTAPATGAQVPEGQTATVPAPTDALDALARLAGTDLGARGRLVFVEPENRIRIVHVDMPAVLVGGDPFGMNGSLTPVVHATSGTAHAGGGAAVGYHPQPARLQVVPPIHGFGPDPAPAPRMPRRAATQPDGAWQVWDGSSPAPLGGNRMPWPAPGAGDDRLALAAQP